MQFSDSNLPELGSEVWFVEKGIPTGRPIVQSGIVFAQLLRYGLSPLILIDIEARAAKDMEHFDERLDRYRSELLFDSAEAAGKSLSLTKGEL